MRVYRPYQDSARMAEVEGRDSLCKIRGGSLWMRRCSRSRGISWVGRGGIVLGVEVLFRWI